MTSGETEAQLPWWDVTKLGEMTTSLEGIDLSAVQQGDIICFGTRSKSLYVFKVERPAIVDKQKGNSCNGLIFGGRYKKPEPVEIKGATWGGGLLVEDQIKKGMRVELLEHLEEPEDLQGWKKDWKTVITSPVEDLKLLETNAQ